MLINQEDKKRIFDKILNNNMNHLILKTISYKNDLYIYYLIKMLDVNENNNYKELFSSLNDTIEDKLNDVISKYDMNHQTGNSNNNKSYEKPKSNMLKEYIKKYENETNTEIRKRILRDIQYNFLNFNGTLRNKLKFKDIKDNTNIFFDTLLLNYTIESIKLPSHILEKLYDKNSTNENFKFSLFSKQTLNKELILKILMDKNTSNEEVDILLECQKKIDENFLFRNENKIKFNFIDKKNSILKHIKLSKKNIEDRYNEKSKISNLEFYMEAVYKQNINENELIIFYNSLSNVRDRKKFKNQYFEYKKGLSERFISSLLDEKNKSEVLLLINNQKISKELSIRILKNNIENSNIINNLLKNQDVKSEDIFNNIEDLNKINRKSFAYITKYVKFSKKDKEKIEKTLNKIKDTNDKEEKISKYLMYQQVNNDFILSIVGDSTTYTYEHKLIRYISKYQKLSDEMIIKLIIKFKNRRISLNDLFINNNITPEIAVKFIDDLTNIELTSYIKYNKVPEKLLNKVKDKFNYKNWEYVSYKQKLSEEFIEENKTKLYRTKNIIKQIPKKNIEVFKGFKDLDEHKQNKENYKIFLYSITEKYKLEFNLLLSKRNENKKIKDKIKKEIKKIQKNNVNNDLEIDLYF